MTKEEQDKMDAREFGEWLEDIFNDPNVEQSLSLKAVWLASRRLLREKEKELPHGKRHFSSMDGNS